MQKEMTQLMALNTRGLDMALSAWHVALAGAEKWTRLNIEASKALLAEAADQAKAVTTLKTVDAVAAYGRTAGTSTVERALGYTRHCQQIAVESQAEATRWIKSTTEELKGDVSKVFADLSASAPQPSKDAAAAALQGATTWTDSVVEVAQRVVKQANDLTDAAINAAADAVNNARSKKGLSA